MYMHGKKLKWARHVERVFDNRMPKRSVGGRLPAGKSGNRCRRCGRMSSNCPIPASRHRSDWWRKARENMARRRAEKS